MRQYQAALTRPENIERARKGRAEARRLGGDLRLEAPNVVGVVVATLTLPDDINPAALFPGIPFYPV